jgi:hypothetical protein
MASDHQRRANQVNARRSTGPRTAAGKRIAARNSLRHGLAADIRYNSPLSKDIEKLALHYYDEALIRDQFVQARIAAEAQFAINHVRQARAAFIERAAVSETREPALAAHDASTIIMDRDAQIHSAICSAAGTLLQFDRYERRALSRRKKALRALFRE